MKTVLRFLFIIVSIFPAWAQNDSTSTLPQASFIVRYRPLGIWNGIGLGYYLHPNHSVEIYGTGQAIMDLWEPEILWERSVTFEYRYYAVNRRKTRWFIAPYFKHGHSRFLYLINSRNLDYIGFWEKRYVKDNILGGVIGFQFNTRYKRRGKSYAEVFAGPQFMFRQYHEHYYSDAPVNQPVRVVKASGGGFVRFGINFCYDFYRKSR